MLNITGRLARGRPSDCGMYRVQRNYHRVNILVSSNEKSLRPSDSEVFLLGLKSSGPTCKRDGDR